MSATLVEFPRSEVVTAEVVRQGPIEIPPAILQERTDFIRTYVGYADVLEVPQMMHEAVAVQIIASVLNSNGVRIPHGANCYSMDIWIVLLSGSGAGRSTLVNLADPLLEGANLGSLVRNIQWGSGPALHQQMASTPSGLFVWGELSEKLQLLNDSRFGGMKQWLTDRYDNFRLPESIEYRQTQKKSQDTPSIIFTARSPDQYPRHKLGGVVFQ